MTLLNVANLQHHKIQDQSQNTDLHQGTVISFFPKTCGRSKNRFHNEDVTPVNL